MSHTQAIKALTALGHVRIPSTQCTAREAETPKDQRPPGPANPPYRCCLKRGHEGPHVCNHGGMYPSVIMRQERIIEGPPDVDVCKKCRTGWPCQDAKAVFDALAC